jgi:hypothetical protein
MPSTEMNADKPFELVQKTYHLQAQPQPIEHSSQNRPSIVRVSNHQPSRKTSVHDVQEATRDDFNRVNVRRSARSLTSLFVFTPEDRRRNTRRFSSPERYSRDNDCRSVDQRRIRQNQVANHCKDQRIDLEVDRRSRTQVRQSRPSLFFSSVPCHH